MKARGSHCYIIVGLATIIAVGLLSGQSASGNPPTSVIDAWMKRSAAVKTFDFKCKGSVFRAKGSVTPPPGTAARTAAPSADTSAPTTMRCALDSTGRLHLTYREETWSFEANKFVPLSLTEVYDGKRRYKLFPYGTLSYPNLFISNTDMADVYRDIRSFPLLLVYRPFHETIGPLGVERAVLEPGRSIVDGKSCQRVTFSARDGLRDTVCVDGEHDFLPLRVTGQFRGTVQYQINIKYRKTTDGSFVPASWTTSLLNPQGGIATSFRIEEVSASINRPLPADIFKVEPPIGAWVHNYVTDESYIVRKNDRRPVLKGEFDGTNYEQLRDSEPGQLGKADWNWKWILLVNAAVLVVALLAFLYYRRKMSRHTAMPSE